MRPIKSFWKPGKQPSAVGRTFAGFAALIVLIYSVDGHAQVLSAKRGFADTGANYANLQATNAGWYYRWGPTKANIGNFDAEFVPMFWYGGDVNQANINTIKNYGDIEWVLGFNEPERADQANMTVSQAISAWQTLTSGLAGTGIKLISPGVSDTGGAAGGQAWLANFMSQASAQGLQVDGVAFHWYGVSTPNDPIGAANAFIGRVDSYYNQYGRPVWITEFAIHDWGGNYSDEEIRNANAIFLANVIPRLESRSYVAGYAWFNWFGDARLVEGNPLVPTNVGFQYVGTITSGTVYDFSGIDLGQHVAYLGGGELTANGVPGTVRYINALSGASTISGAANWGLNNSTDWVRIQPGATLRKHGTNQITWNGSVTNNGVIEVAAGTLRLANNVNMSGTGTFQINQGGTLKIDGTGRGIAVTYPIELRGGTLATELVGGFIVAPGANLSGHGTIAANMTASGTVIRVGGDGLSAPRRFVIDSFENYAFGDVRDVASPPWTAHQNTSLADIENLAGNKVLTFGWANDFRGTSRDLPENAAIGDDGVATIFFRFNSKTDDPDHSFGLGDQADTSAVNFGNYEGQLRIVDSPGVAGTYTIDARNGGSFTAPLATGLALNTWYNVWLVVDQAADTYDVYLNTGTANATATNKLNASPLTFRNGTTSPLNKILGLAGPGPIDNGVRFDDLVYLTGVDLTNPTGGLVPGVITNPATLLVQGNLILNAGAILELDIFDPTAVDKLAVTGNFVAGGILDVSLDAAAPAPSHGDSFDLIDWGTISGQFTSLLLPQLAGLAWNTDRLYIDGTISVALPGDFNGDGAVDAADYVVWRKRGGTQTEFNTWRTNFGRTADGGTTSSTSVPEPAALLLSAWAIIALVATYRRSNAAFRPAIVVRQAEISRFPRCRADNRETAAGLAPSASGKALDHSRRGPGSRAGLSATIRQPLDPHRSPRRAPPGRSRRSRAAFQRSRGRSNIRCAAACASAKAACTS
jgi:hypothetical protein